MKTSNDENRFKRKLFIERSEHEERAQIEKYARLLRVRQKRKAKEASATPINTSALEKMVGR